MKFSLTCIIVFVVLLLAVCFGFARKAHADTSPPNAVLTQLTLNTSAAPAHSVAAQRASLPTAPVLHIAKAAAYVNPISISFAAGYATSGYNHGWGSHTPMLEAAVRYRNFLGPISLFGTARYATDDQSGYWRSKDQWTAAAELPFGGGGAVLFARYENHFRVDDDWLWGGLRFNLQ